MPVLNESEIEAVTDTYTQEDQARSKTWSRRIVENYLQHVSEAYTCIVYFMMMNLEYILADSHHFPTDAPE
jgi:glutamine synthetase